MDKNDKNDNNSKIARAIGQITGIAIIGCAAACVCGIAVALTIKFLIWIF